MLNPQTIVEQVWQRIVPTDWRIIRGKRRSSFSLAARTTLITCALLVLALLLAAGISLVLRARQAGQAALALEDVASLAATPLAGYPAGAVGLVGVAALSLLVGLLTWIISARRHAGDPDPVIVLVPEGFVEYVSQRQPIIGIRYAKVAAVEVGQGKKQRQATIPGAASQASTRSKLWLYLRYHDGTTDRWRPRANFGPPERVYETISKAHALYDILYGGGR
jgi:hypothetical protein